MASRPGRSFKQPGSVVSKTSAATEHLKSGTRLSGYREESCEASNFKRCMKGEFVECITRDENFTGEKGKQGKKGPRETKLQKTESLNVPVKLGGEDVQQIKGRMQRNAECRQRFKAKDSVHQIEVQEQLHAPALSGPASTSAALRVAHLLSTKSQK